MDFNNGAELLRLCGERNLAISEIMKIRELAHGGCSEAEIDEKMRTAFSIMDSSTHAPLKDPQKSIGKLIGGEAKQVHAYWQDKRTLCGDALTKAIAYAMAVLETNASMGLIVAAPTAGASGVLPGMLMSLKETYGLKEEAMFRGLLNAGAIGYLAMRNASVAGAEAGCQAEVGIASAMAASAATELMGGTQEQCLQAASLSISNLLGLVCDPVGGYVESPCQSRNAIGVANAFTCAQLALSGIKHINSFDEMLDVMLTVGRSMPASLRETALGGNAATKSACAHCGGI